MAKHLVMGIVMVAMGSYAADGNKKRNRDDLLGNSPAHSPYHSPRPSDSPAGSPVPGAGRGRAPSFSSGIRFSSSLSHSSSLDALSSRSSESLSVSSSGTSSVASTPSDPTVRPPIAWPTESGDAQTAKKHKISTESESGVTFSPGAGAAVMPREPLRITPADSGSMAVDQESQPLLLLPPQAVDEGSPTTALAEPLQQLHIQATAMTLASLRSLDSAAMPPPSAQLPVPARMEKKKELTRKGSSSSDEDTDLHTAAYQGDIDLVKVLLPKIDINAQNKEGDTPLHAAVKGSILDDKRFHMIIEALIQAKADVRLLNHDKQTALDFATLYVHDPVIIEFLQKAAASGGGAGLV